jgi:hypothetical protein
MARQYFLDKALINKESYIIRGKYGLDDDDCKDILFTLKLVSFEQITYKLFYQNRFILNLLKNNDIYILICDLLNMTKNKMYSLSAYPCVVLNDTTGNHYYPCGSLDSFYNCTGDYFEKRGLCEFESAWVNFPPNIKIKGAISYLLPKDKGIKYFLSVLDEDEDHYFKDGSICTLKEYNERHIKSNLSDEGWIYALVNPSMADNFVKIGMTTRAVEARVNELSSKTSVPTPFTIIYKKEVSNCKRVEALIHSKLKKYRYQKNREFFEVSPNKLVPFLDNLCSNFPKRNDLPSSEDDTTRKKVEEIENQIELLRSELKFLKKV